MLYISKKARNVRHDRFDRRVKKVSAPEVIEPVVVEPEVIENDITPEEVKPEAVVPEPKRRPRKTADNKEEKGEEDGRE